MVTTTAQIRNALIPGLQEVFYDWHTYGDVWKQIYAVWHSEKAVEYDQEMQGLPAAYLKQQGAPTQLADMPQAYTTAYYPNYFSIGFVFTRQAIMDNLYKDKIPMAGTNLKNSLREAKNIQGADVLNNGFNPAYPIGDGQPLYSTAHPISTGTSANTFSIPVGLNEASLNDLNVLLYNIRSAAGIKNPYRARKLITTPTQQFTASILTGSKYMPDSANNAINPVVETGMFPEGYSINPYLTAPYSWFVITDCPVGFKHIVREEPYFFTDTDSSTQNVVVTVSERYAFGNSNWRSTAGSQGAL